MKKREVWLEVFAQVVIWTAITISVQAQNCNSDHPCFALLADFTQQGNGNYPDVPLTQGIDGALYGTWGETFFRVTRDGNLTNLYTFCDITLSECGRPDSRLLLEPDGYFYGTTRDGPHGLGEVFKIKPGGAAMTLFGFYPLCGPQVCSEGFQPEGGLIRANDGSLYGATYLGGFNNCYYWYGDPQTCGTIFKIHKNHFGLSFQTIYKFCPQPRCSDGVLPMAGLIQATDGSFYGTTTDPFYMCDSPYKPCGTFFRLSPDGELTTLYSFCTEDNCTDGANPGGVIEASNGDFYGTTFGDGWSVGGTIFRVNRLGQLTTLQGFNCNQTSCYPSSLVQATDGNFYGTMLGGYGQPGAGLIFKMTPEGALTNLFNFPCLPVHNICPVGANPGAGLLQATDGNFYGVASAGGKGTCTWNEFTGCGTIFRLDVGLDPFVAFVQAYGKVGEAGGILGQGFTGTTSVAINGISANFKVVSDTYLTATVPQGATTGYVTVTTPAGNLKSNMPFRVIP